MHDLIIIIDNTQTNYNTTNITNNSIIFLIKLHLEAATIHIYLTKNSMVIQPTNNKTKGKKKQCKKNTNSIKRDYTKNGQ